MDREMLMSRILMWVGIIGVAVTLALEYLGVFREWGLILTVAFGLVGVAGFIQGATRRGVTQVLTTLVAVVRNQDRTSVRIDETNTTLRRMADTLERIERRLPPPSEP